jgi:hypothetical protein
LPQPPRPRALPPAAARTAAPDARGPLFTPPGAAVQRMEFVGGSQPPERPNQFPLKSPAPSKKQKKKEKRKEKRERDVKFEESKKQMSLISNVGGKSKGEIVPKNANPNNNNTTEGSKEVADNEGKRKLIPLDDEQAIQDYLKQHSTVYDSNTKQKKQKKRKSSEPKYNVHMGCYIPIKPHKICKSKHISGEEDKVKLSSQIYDGRKTKVLKEEAKHALKTINNGHARYLRVEPNNENPVNVIVLIDGREWGAHITDPERRIYPTD